MKIIFIRLDIIRFQIPILKNDINNNKHVFIIVPNNVPIIASLALFIACILVVSGPWI